MAGRIEDHLFGLVRNPPRGSRIEAATRHGIDLTLNLRTLLLTPDERVREMQAALRLVEEIERARTAAL